MDFILNEKAQLGISTLISIFLVIIVFAALTPTLNYFVNYAATELGAFSQATLIITLFPLAIVLGIFWGIFIKSKPYYDSIRGRLS